MYFSFTLSCLIDLIFRHPNIIFINRAVFPLYFPFTLRGLYRFLLKDKLIIWQFDDNIRFNEISKFEWDLLCDVSSKIMVANEALRDTLDKSYQQKAIVSYMNATDGDITEDIIKKYAKIKEVEYDKNIQLVWVATSSNLPNLDYVIDSIDQAAMELKKEYHKEVILNVVCNIKYVRKCHSLKINNIKWSRDLAINWICRSHIGIMPLINNEYNRGKSGFKIVQYLSSGIPTIASDMSKHREFLMRETGYAGLLVSDLENPNEWKESIIKLSTNFNLWKEYGRNALRCKSIYHNYEVEKEKFDMLFSCNNVKEPDKE